MNFDLQLRVVCLEFIAQSVQTLLAPRHQEEERGTIRKLAGKLPSDSGGSSGDQCMASIQTHHGALFVRMGSRTRQTFSATTLCPAAVG